MLTLIPKRRPKMAQKKNVMGKIVKAQVSEEYYEEPKRLSKAGEWRKAHPNGVGGYVDWKAVMR